MGNQTETRGDALGHGQRCGLVSSPTIRAQLFCPWLAPTVTALLGGATESCTPPRRFAVAVVPGTSRQKRNDKWPIRVTRRDKPLRSSRSSVRVARIELAPSGWKPDMQPLTPDPQLEPLTGIEPVSRPYQGRILPLNYGGRAVTSSAREWLLAQIIGMVWMYSRAYSPRWSRRELHPHS